MSYPLGYGLTEDMYSDPVTETPEPEPPAPPPPPQEPERTRGGRNRIEDLGYQSAGPDYTQEPVREEPAIQSSTGAEYLFAGTDVAPQLTMSEPPMPELPQELQGDVLDHQFFTDNDQQVAWWNSEVEKAIMAGDQDRLNNLLEEGDRFREWAGLYNQYLESPEYQKFQEYWQPWEPSPSRGYEQRYVTPVIGRVTGGPEGSLDIYGEPMLAADYAWQLDDLHEELAEQQARYNQYVGNQRNLWRFNVVDQIQTTPIGEVINAIRTTGASSPADVIREAGRLLNEYPPSMVGEALAFDMWQRAPRNDPRALGRFLIQNYQPIALIMQGLSQREVNAKLRQVDVGRLGGQAERPVMIEMAIVNSMLDPVEPVVPQPNRGFLGGLVFSHITESPTAVAAASGAGGFIADMIGQSDPIQWSKAAWDVVGSAVKDSAVWTGTNAAEGYNELFGGAASDVWSATKTVQRQPVIEPVTQKVWWGAVGTFDRVPRYLGGKIHELENALPAVYEYMRGYALAANPLGIMQLGIYLTNPDHPMMIKYYREQFEKTEKTLSDPELLKQTGTNLGAMIAGSGLELAGLDNKAYWKGHGWIDRGYYNDNIRPELIEDYEDDIVKQVVYESLLDPAGWMAVKVPTLFRFGRFLTTASYIEDGFLARHPNAAPAFRRLHAGRNGHLTRRGFERQSQKMLEEIYGNKKIDDIIVEAVGEKNVDNPWIAREFKEFGLAVYTRLLDKPNLAPQEAFGILHDEAVTLSRNLDAVNAITNWPLPNARRLLQDDWIRAIAEELRIGGRAYDMRRAIEAMDAGLSPEDFRESERLIRERNAQAAVEASQDVLIETANPARGNGAIDITIGRLPPAVPPSGAPIQNDRVRIVIDAIADADIPDKLPNYPLNNSELQRIQIIKRKLGVDISSMTEDPARVRYTFQQLDAEFPDVRTEAALRMREGQGGAGRMAQETENIINEFPRYKGNLEALMGMPGMYLDADTYDAVVKGLSYRVDDFMQNPQVFGKIPPRTTLLEDGALPSRAQLYDLERLSINTGHDYMADAAKLAEEGKFTAKHVNALINRAINEQPPSERLIVLAHLLQQEGKLPSFIKISELSHRRLLDHVSEVIGKPRRPSSSEPRFPVATWVEEIGATDHPMQFRTGQYYGNIKKDMESAVADVVGLFDKHERWQADRDLFRRLLPDTEGAAGRRLYKVDPQRIQITDLQAALGSDFFLLKNPMVGPWITELLRFDPHATGQNARRVLGQHLDDLLDMVDGGAIDDRVLARLRLRLIQAHTHRGTLAGKMEFPIGHETIPDAYLRVLEPNIERGTEAARPVQQNAAEEVRRITGDMKELEQQIAQSELLYKPVTDILNLIAPRLGDNLDFWRAVHRRISRATRNETFIAWQKAAEDVGLSSERLNEDVLEQIHNSLVIYKKATLGDTPGVDIPEIVGHLGQEIRKVRDLRTQHLKLMGDSAEMHAGMRQIDPATANGMDALPPASQAEEVIQGAEDLGLDVIDITDPGGFFARNVKRAQQPVERQAEIPDDFSPPMRQRMIQLLDEHPNESADNLSEQVYLEFETDDYLAGGDEIGIQQEAAVEAGRGTEEAPVLRSALPVNELSGPSRVGEASAQSIAGWAQRFANLDGLTDQVDELPIIIADYPSAWKNAITGPDGVFPNMYSIQQRMKAAINVSEYKLMTRPSVSWPDVPEEILKRKRAAEDLVGNDAYRQLMQEIQLQPTESSGFIRYFPSQANAIPSLDPVTGAVREFRNKQIMARIQAQINRYEPGMMPRTAQRDWENQQRALRSMVLQRRKSTMPIFFHVDGGVDVNDKTIADQVENLAQKLYATRRTELGERIDRIEDIAAPGASAGLRAERGQTTKGVGALRKLAVDFHKIFYDELRAINLQVPEGRIVRMTNRESLDEFFSEEEIKILLEEGVIQKPDLKQLSRDLIGADKFKVRHAMDPKRRAKLANQVLRSQEHYVLSDFGNNFLNPYVRGWQDDMDANYDRLLDTWMEEIREWERLDEPGVALQRETVSGVLPEPVMVQEGFPQNMRGTVRLTEQKLPEAIREIMGLPSARRSAGGQIAPISRDELGKMLQDVREDAYDLYYWLRPADWETRHIPYEAREPRGLQYGNRPLKETEARLDELRKIERPSKGVRDEIAALEKKRNSLELTDSWFVAQDDADLMRSQIEFSQLDNSDVPIGGGGSPRGLTYFDDLRYKGIGQFGASYMAGLRRQQMMRLVDLSVSDHPADIAIRSIQSMGDEAFDAVEGVVLKNLDETTKQRMIANGLADSSMYDSAEHLVLTPKGLTEVVARQIAHATGKHISEGGSLKVRGRTVRFAQPDDADIAGAVDVPAKSISIGVDEADRRLELTAQWVQERLDELITDAHDIVKLEDEVWRLLGSAGNLDRAGATGLKRIVESWTQWVAHSQGYGFISPGGKQAAYVVDEATGAVKRVLDTVKEATFKAAVPHPIVQRMRPHSHNWRNVLSDDRLLARWTETMDNFYDDIVRNNKEWGVTLDFEHTHLTDSAKLALDGEVVGMDFLNWASELMEIAHSTAPSGADQWRHVDFYEDMREIVRAMSVPPGQVGDKAFLSNGLELAPREARKHFYESNAYGGLVVKLMQKHGEALANNWDRVTPHLSLRSFLDDIVWDDFDPAFRIGRSEGTTERRIADYFPTPDEYGYFNAEQMETMHRFFVDPEFYFGFSDDILDHAGGILRKQLDAFREATYRNWMGIENATMAENYGVVRRAFRTDKLDPTETKRWHPTHTSEIDQALFPEIRDEPVDEVELVENMVSELVRLEAREIGFDPFEMGFAGDIMKMQHAIKKQLVPLWMTMVPRYHVNNFFGNLLAAIGLALRGDSDFSLPIRNRRFEELANQPGSGVTASMWKDEGLTHTEVNQADLRFVGAKRDDVPMPFIGKEVRLGGKNINLMHNWIEGGTKLGTMSERYFKHAVYTAEYMGYYAKVWRRELDVLSPQLDRAVKRDLLEAAGLVETRAVLAKHSINGKLADDLLSAQRTSLASAQTKAYVYTMKGLRDYRMRNKLDNVLDYVIPVHYWQTHNWLFLGGTLKNNPWAALAGARAYNTYAQQWEDEPPSARNKLKLFEVPEQVPVLGGEKLWLSPRQITNPGFWAMAEALPETRAIYNRHKELGTLDRALASATDGRNMIWELSGNRIGPQYELGILSIAAVDRETGLSGGLDKKIADALGVELDAFSRIGGMAKMLAGSDGYYRSGLLPFGGAEQFGPLALEQASRLTGKRGHEFVSGRVSDFAHALEYMNETVYGTPYSRGEMTSFFYELHTLYRDGEYGEVGTDEALRAYVADMEAARSGDFSSEQMRKAMESAHDTSGTNSFISWAGFPISRHSQDFQMAFEADAHFEELVRNGDFLSIPASSHPSTRTRISTLNDRIKAAQDRFESDLDKGVPYATADERYEAEVQRVWDIADKQNLAVGQRSQDAAWTWMREEAPWLYGMWAVTWNEEKLNQARVRLDKNIADQRYYESLDAWWSGNMGGMNEARPLFSKLANLDAQYDKDVASTDNPFLLNQYEARHRNDRKTIFEEMERAGISVGGTGRPPQHGQTYLAWRYGAPSVAAVEIIDGELYPGLREDVPNQNRIDDVLANDAMGEVDRYERQQAQREWFLDLTIDALDLSIYDGDGNINVRWQHEDDPSRVDWDKYERHVERTAREAPNVFNDLVRSIRDVSADSPGRAIPAFLVDTRGGITADEFTKHVRGRQDEVDEYFSGLSKLRDRYYSMGSDEEATVEGELYTKDELRDLILRQYGPDVLTRDPMSTNDYGELLVSQDADGNIIAETTLEQTDDPFAVKQAEEGRYAVQNWYFNNLTPGQKDRFEKKYPHAFPEVEFERQDGTIETRTQFNVDLLDPDEVFDIRDKNKIPLPTHAGGDRAGERRRGTQVDSKLYADQVKTAVTLFHENAMLSDDEKGRLADFERFVKGHSEQEQAAQELRDEMGDGDSKLSWRGAQNVAIERGDFELAMYIQARIDLADDEGIHEIYAKRDDWLLNTPQGEMLRTDMPESYSADDYKTPEERELADFYWDMGMLYPDERDRWNEWESWQSNNRKSLFRIEHYRKTVAEDAYWSDMPAILESIGEPELAKVAAQRNQLWKGLDIGSIYDHRNSWLATSEDGQRLRELDAGFNRYLDDVANDPESERQGGGSSNFGGGRSGGGGRSRSNRPGRSISYRDLPQQDGTATSEIASHLSALDPVLTDPNHPEWSQRRAWANASSDALGRLQMLFSMLPQNQGELLLGILWSGVASRLPQNPQQQHWLNLLKWLRIDPMSVPPLGTESDQQPPTTNTGAPQAPGQAPSAAPAAAPPMPSVPMGPPGSHLTQGVGY